MPRVVLDPSLGVLASAFGCTRRGASHKRSDTVCQDAYLLADMSAAGFPMLLVAIADGHGGNGHERSHIGAHLALQATMQSLGWLLLGAAKNAECARDQLSDFASQTPRSESLCPDGAIFPADFRRNFHEHFPRMVCRLWREHILFHGKESGDEDEVLADPLFPMRYGTTLLAAVTMDESILLARIGDGDFVLLGQDEHGGWMFQHPLALSDDLVGGETRSLCSNDAWRFFRTETIARNGVSMLALSTDGLRNAYEDDASFHNLLLGVLRNIRAYGSFSASTVLPEYLDRFSSYGSGDDITLAGVCFEPRPADDAASEEGAASGVRGAGCTPELVQQTAHASSRQDERAVTEDSGV